MKHNGTSRRPILIELTHVPHVLMRPPSLYTQHCFTPFKYFYSADTYGKSSWAADLYPNTTDVSSGELVLASTTTLLNWTAALPLDEGESLRSACSGEIKGKDEWRGTTYCAPFVVQQSYTSKEG